MAALDWNNNSNNNNNTNTSNSSKTNDRKNEFSLQFFHFLLRLNFNKNG